MTIKDLSRYHSIKIEIQQLENNITELETTLIGSAKITGMPIVSHKNSSPTERIGIKLTQLREKLVDKQEKLLDETHKIEDFLETIDDAEIRIIIRERFLNGKTWNDIAKKIIADRSTPYYKLKKYLKDRKNEYEENKKTS